MEKLTVAGNFVKNVELLRNTECSQKGKLNHFHQISECIISPAMQSNAQFNKHASNAISILLFFCEDLDSVARMSAEENLYRIIRCLEVSKVSRILLDLCNEIKKNGNYRSLRICLNLFAYYCPKIKERNVKGYALKLLPSLQTIAQRKETLLVEALTEFMKSFSKHLQICLNDNETYKLLQVFLANITSECTVKRRCSSQNCITLIQNSRNKRTMTKHALTKAIDLLLNDQQSNTIIGVLGLLRLLVPTIDIDNINDCREIIEIYDFCLHLLNDNNHSIINASLEVINAILCRQSRIIEGILTSHQLYHNEILNKRKSLKNKVFQLKTLEKVHPENKTITIESNKQEISRKSSVQTIKAEKKATVDADAAEKKSFEFVCENSVNIDENDGSSDDRLDDTVDCSYADDDPTHDDFGIVVASRKDSIGSLKFETISKDDHSTMGLADDKSLSPSDADNESFHSADIESEITIGEMSDNKKLKEETGSLKSQKSKDSIEWFFNNILSHPESMPKLFRQSTTKQSPASTGKATTTSDQSMGSTPKSQSFMAARKSEGKNFLKNNWMMAIIEGGSGSAAASGLPVSGTVTGTKLGVTNVAESSTFEDDTISLESLNSHISLSSHVSQQSGAQEYNIKNEQDLLHQNNDYLNHERFLENPQQNVLSSSLPMPLSLSSSATAAIQTKTDERDLSDYQSKNDIFETEQNPSIVDGKKPEDDKNGGGGNTSFDDTISKQRGIDCDDVSGVGIDDAIESGGVDNRNCKLNIGTIYDQNIVYYTVRLIASKFLLNGRPGGLILDKIVRVSIKNLSLNVIANCVKLKPEVLQLPFELDKSEMYARDELLTSFDDSNHESNDISNDYDMGDPIDELGDANNESTKLSCDVDNFKNKPCVNVGDCDGLEIKDDHFGENTTISYCDFLSKSADHILIANLTQGVRFDTDISKSDDVSFQNVKLSQQLENILSKSDIIDRKTASKYRRANLEMFSSSPFKTTLTTKDGAAVPKFDVEIEAEIEVPRQFISDILLYHKHTDPVLRGNVLTIIGNFIRQQLLTFNLQNQSQNNGALNLNQLLTVLIKGLRDETHTVVIQALNCFDKTFPLLTSDYFNLFRKDEGKLSDLNDECLQKKGMNTKSQREMSTICMQYNSPPKVFDLARGRADKKGDNDEGNDKDNNKEIENLHSKDVGKIIITPKVLLNRLHLCYDNKYWLVQNKYSDVISNLNFRAIEELYGADVAHSYEDIFFRQLLHFLGENDFRVRDHAAKCICQYIIKQQNKDDKLTRSDYSDDIALLADLINNNNSNRLSIFPIECQKIDLKGNRILSRVLYSMSNMLLELDDQNLQFGIIIAIKKLMNAFNPVDYYSVWNEFNLTEICTHFAYENYATAIDLGAQSNLIAISTNLLKANILAHKLNPHIMDLLLSHILKILNIYHILFYTNSEVKPTLFPKSPKNTLVGSLKESKNLQNLGNWFNDHFYIKLYAIIKGSLENYKIAINNDSGSKLMTLLTTCLDSLSLLLEFKSNETPSNELRLVVEIIEYLTSLVNHAPVETIACLRQLLKFLFARNCGSQSGAFEKCLQTYFFEKNGLSTSPTKTSAANIGDGTVSGAVNTAELRDFFEIAFNLALHKSPHESDCAKHIKLFEPLVIYCLRLFMKSNANVQASILDLLSQLIEFNVTYSILDSKNVIFDQVIKNTELIETGIARNATSIIRPTVKFLTDLTKQAGNELITIPKIISMINSLLANNNIRECGVLALKELAFEVFFQDARTIAHSRSTFLNPVELGTQKEVIIRMLEKFITHIECQRTLATILLWQKIKPKPENEIPGNPTEYEPILIILIRALQDNRICIENEQQYNVLCSILRNSDKNLLLESKTFEGIFAVFLELNVDNYSNLSLSNMIFDNTIAKTEEVYLLNQLKLYLKNNPQNFPTTTGLPIASTSASGSTSDSTTPIGTVGGGGSEINYFVKIVCNKLETVLSTLIKYPEDEDYRFMVVKYINCLSTVSKYGILSNALRIYLEDNEFCEKYLMPILLPFQALQGEILKFLCEINFNKTIVLQHLAAINKNSIKKTIIAYINRKYNDINRWTLGEINILMSESLLPVVIEERPTLLLNLCQHEQYAYIVLDSMMQLQCLSTNETIINVLKLMSSFNRKTFAFKLKLLYRMLARHNISKTIQRRLERSIQDEINFALSLQRNELIELCSPSATTRPPSIITDFNNIHEIWCSTNGNLQKLSNATVKALRSLSTVLHQDRTLPFECLPPFEGKSSSESIENIQQQHRIVIDEEWLIKEIVKLSNGMDNVDSIVKILIELKSESKLKMIFRSKEIHNEMLVRSCIAESFRSMIFSFLNDCVLYNPHINYLKIHPLLKVSLSALMQQLQEVVSNPASGIGGRDCDSSSGSGACDEDGSGFADGSYHEEVSRRHFDDNFNSLTRNKTLASAVVCLMESIDNFEKQCLIHVEMKFLEKFIKQHILRPDGDYKLLIAFIVKCSNSVTELLRSREQSSGCAFSQTVNIFMRCVDAVLRQRFVWIELNNVAKYETELNAVLDMLHIGMVKSVENTIFYERYKARTCSPSTCNEISNDVESSSIQMDRKIGDSTIGSGRIGTENGHSSGETNNFDNTKNMYKLYMNSPTDRLQKAIFIAKLIEARNDDTDPRWMNISESSSMKLLKSIGISLFRSDYFYAFAVTPFDLFQNLGYDETSSKNNSNNSNRSRSTRSNRIHYFKFPSIPVEHLSDVDILQKFIRRLSIFGFSTRKQFEEYFMTFLLLINKSYDENMVDEQEQFQIKSKCLTAIQELLITCKTCPDVGNKRSMFLHSTRWPRIKCDNISTRKLYKVQLLIPGSNVYFCPNLERNISIEPIDNLVTTKQLLPNQFSLNYIWQQMETGGDGDVQEDSMTKTSRYLAYVCGIDQKSSAQLIFDIYCQLLEAILHPFCFYRSQQNHVNVLPNLSKFCEICDNRDHIRHINGLVNKLQETIPMDDTISHQYIIYILCKTQSILVPSYSDLSHLCTLISVYLKSSHVFIRNATLHGLLGLLECCAKTNTAMGKLSDELSLLRTTIVDYIIRHGIIEDSSIQFSAEHTKLVWSLNFSLIELTTKFVPDCNLLANTIISANNILKRATDEGIFLSILHGLERIILTTNVSKPICDKIEKLALELVKLENEKFSIPSLKLLVCCVYIGSAKQLENTEHSNGIVQDDPEIIVQQTERVDVLLQRIKSSTSSSSRIYGEVLCQIIRDLVPPKEILTKVIKEFLTINQSHCEVIARIVFQVFRSAIDSSFLQMLQDWLIFSLANFLSLPIEKGVWCLTVIFFSSSINLHLIKLFPFVLNEFRELNKMEIALFVTSAQDFYMKLNSEQKQTFRDVFMKSELNIYQDMLKSL